jgi:peptidoglycan/LPS O-acetylase OafA/YrhL
VCCDRDITAPILTAAEPAAPQVARARYLPGIDGLRAIAVVAVLLYHADVSWIPGGFLGVDVFFVISGYLITMLLLEEHRRTGAIGIRGFYTRRARRLLPALFVLLLTVCVVAALFYRKEMADLRAQVVAAATYCTNWYLIASGGSYFEELGRPLALRHLWSLAVEEQFYLLWPLAMVLLLRHFRGRLGHLAMAISAVTVASAIWMGVLYRPGVDPSRLYYGSDTRLSTLLVGALLALFWRPAAIAHGGVRRHGRLFDLVGLAALAGIGLFFLQAHETSGALYRGGFLALAVVSALVVAAATHPGTATGKALGVGLLTWIGVRSYALYLWHWPVFVVTRPGVDVPLRGWPLLALRLGVTVALADLSYRLVETPVRQMGFRLWFRDVMRSGTPGPRRPARLALVGAMVAAGAGLTAVLVSRPAPVSDIEQSLRAGQQAIAESMAASRSTAAPTRHDETSAVTTVRSRTEPPSVPASVASTAAPTTVPTTVAAPPTTVPATPTVTVPATVAPVVAPPVAFGGGPIVALGDSVMLGAAPQLLERFGPGTLVDAQVGRTLWPIIGIVDALRAQGRLGERVVVHLGDNGGVDAALIARTMASLSDADRVVWVNVKVPRSWEAPVNAILAAEVPKYPNARLLDWKGLATDPSLFYEDGIHLRPAGAQVYAQLVEAALAQP